jgi:hypothetical protein
MPKVPWLVAIIAGLIVGVIVAPFETMKALSLSRFFVRPCAGRYVF